MLKKKSFLVILVLFCSLSMTSCIGIIEKMLFNKDGGGTYSMTLDMSKLAQMLSSFGSGSSDEVDLGLDSLNNVFDDRAKKMEAVHGVSNIRQEVDKEKLIFTLLFDFEDVDALNRGMSEYYKEEGDIQTKQYVFFTENKGTIERTDVNRVLDALDFAMQSDEVGEDFDPAIILSDMFYEQQLSFEGKIKSFSNPDYEQGNGLNWGEKALRWTKYLFKASDKDKDLQVTVKTK